MLESLLLKPLDFKNFNLLTLEIEYLFIPQSPNYCV